MLCFVPGYLSVTTTTNPRDIGAPHAVVRTLMRERYYCVYLYMLCWLMY